jgi:hypothetical protein
MDGWIPLEADKSSFAEATADKIGFDWVCFDNSS